MSLTAGYLPIALILSPHLMRLRPLTRQSLLLALAVMVVPNLAWGQAPAQQRLVVLEVPGQELDDLSRSKAALRNTSDSTATSYLMRSVSTRLARSPRDGLVRVDLVAPEYRTVWNSQLPWSQNDGALFAGRGMNTVLRGGLVFEVGPVRAIVAPELINEQNLDFQTIPYADKGARSIWANPFHGLPESIDLPLRFGNRGRRRAASGQSSLTIDIGPVVTGITAENQWWGPSMRNALVLGPNAAGVPRIFLRTRQPLPTRYGTFDAQWFLGRLSESNYFDYDSTNNSRALSGVVATWRPPHTSHAEFGVARLVMTPVVSNDISLGTAFNVFHDVGRPNTQPKHPGNYTAPDQIFSLFGRLALPDDGFESWFEWARTEQPISFRDLLEQPAHSQGYTIGAQLVRPLADSATNLRFRVEATYFEPSPSLRFQPGLLTSYTSRAVPQGFTQDGQMLGAAIGPGSSSQFASLDFIRNRWTAGLFGGRIRYDNGMLFESTIPEVKREDIMMFMGIRGHLVWRGLRVGAEFQNMVRLNYLYQAYLADERTGTSSGIDFRNRTLSIVLSPAKGF